MAALAATLMMIAGVTLGAIGLSNAVECVRAPCPQPFWSEAPMLAGGALFVSGLALALIATARAWLRNR